MDPAIAHDIARTSHAGQVTRFGEPQSDHVERVAAMVPSDVQAVAFLHDVLEHSEVALDALRAQGLTPVEQAALLLLTRTPDETFEAHALRIAFAPGAAGRLARAVRRADLDDHLAHRPLPGDAPAYGWARRHVVGAQALYNDAGELESLAS